MSAGIGTNQVDKDRKVDHVDKHVSPMKTETFVLQTGLVNEGGKETNVVHTTVFPTLPDGQYDDN
jgi:hypothetical protein